MGDEFYSVIKLITGEEIFSCVCVDENDGDPVLVLQNPVIMKMSRTPHGTSLRVSPWMEIPSDDIFIVKLDKIITMTEVKDEDIIMFYNRYLQESEEDDESSFGSNQTKLTNKMGYVSSVEDARKLLEDLYKLKDNKES
jgi:hypothetical protein